MLASATALAQSDDDSAQTLRGQTLDTLETVGQITYQTGDVLNNEETLSHASISREQLSRSPAELAEVISQETGIQYKQIGGFGSYAAVSIRAASAAQTGVYLNGVLLNSGGNPVIDLSTLEILNLESVDIYRGGTPSQLGDGGIGGAVNLKTIRANDNSPATRLKFELGSFSQTGIQASHQLSSGKWDWIAAASRRQSDNDFTYLNNNGTPLNPNDDELQPRENAHALRSSALLRGGYQHSNSRRSDITVQLASRESGVPEWRNQAANQASYDTDSSQLQLSHVHDGINGWNSRQTVYRHTDNNHFIDLGDPENSNGSGYIGLGRQDTVNRITNEGAKTYWEYPSDTGTLGLSVEYRQEKLEAGLRLDNANSFDAEREKWLAIAHYTWYDSTGNLTLTPAIRWQSDRYRSTRPSDNSAASENQNNGDQPGAQLGLGFQASHSVSFSANIGSYYRPPSFGELYSSIGLVNGNAQLRSEQGLNADLGIQLKADAMSLSASVFASLRDELIVTSFDSRGVGRTVNSGAAEVAGVELGIHWRISDTVSLRSNLTWQSAKSVDKTTEFYGNFLPGEAQLAWFGRLDYAAKNWRSWYEITQKHTSFYDRANILPAADTTLHSAGLGWEKGDWQLSLIAKNLGDEAAEDFNGFPKPGRSYSLLTTLSF